MTKRSLPMAFYHQKGHVPAWQQASKYAGPSGRVATLPDIIEARLATKPGEVPWETWFTTNSAEYVGRSRAGNRIIIVAHGVGPMATLDGALKAYAHEYKDKTRRNNGGRISREEFLALEAGTYGEVAIVDLDHYLLRYRYPFSEHLTARQALADPLLKARFGERLREYVKEHSAGAWAYHREEGHGEVNDPRILKLDDAANCSYEYHAKDEGTVLAHLLSIGRLVCAQLSGEGAPRHPILSCDVSAHEWWNGCRFVGIPHGATMAQGIHEGVDPHEAIRKHWQALLGPAEAPAPGRHMYLLKEIAEGVWFSEYPKEGARMNTGEPEYRVLAKKPVGNPVKFRTEGGSVFVKYDISEIRAIAPAEANAYMCVTEFQASGNDHECMVQFYRADLDYSARLPRRTELENDFDRLMELAEV